MNPLSLSIIPDPDAHSGHRRLQWLVSSKDTVAGIPAINGSPVTELAAQENADFTAFTDLTIIPFFIRM